MVLRGVAIGVNERLSMNADRTDAPIIMVMARTEQADH